MYRRSTILLALLILGLVSAQTIDFYGITIPIDEKFSDVMSFSTSTTSGNDPSSPSIRVTDGSKTKFYVDAKDSFDCKTGQLNITVPDGIIGGKLGLFNEAPPYLNMVILPIDGNKSIFTILASSTYSLVAIDFPSYVQLNAFRKEFILCPEQAVPEPTINETKPVEPVPAEIPKQTPPVITKEDAVFAISVANEGVSIAITENKDVSAAQLKLEEATLALSAGNYNQAKKFAEEAFMLAKDAKAKASITKPTTVAVKQEPVQQSGMSVFQLALVIGVAFVVILVYLILSERKTRVTKKK